MWGKLKFLFTMTWSKYSTSLSNFTVCYYFEADSSCWSINCGGTDITIKENGTVIKYEGDGNVDGGTAKFYLNEESFWGLSSSGDFMDDFDFQNTRYIVHLPSSNLTELYKTARVTPISLTYFHRCLENGVYTLNLHFAEIQFTNDETYSSLGKRFFDIYVQVWISSEGKFNAQLLRDCSRACFVAGKIGTEGLQYRRRGGNGWEACGYTCTKRQRDESWIGDQIVFCGQRDDEDPQKRSIWASYIGYFFDLG